MKVPSKPSIMREKANKINLFLEIGRGSPVSDQKKTTGPTFPRRASCEWIKLLRCRLGNFSEISRFYNRDLRRIDVLL